MRPIVLDLPALSILAACENDPGVVRPYDTTERDSFTHWGDGTADEMCLTFFYVTRR